MPFDFTENYPYDSLCKTIEFLLTQLQLVHNKSVPRLQNQLRDLPYFQADFEFFLYLARYLILHISELKLFCLCGIFLLLNVAIYCYKLWS